MGDLRKTGFPDNYFDAYFSWGVLEHFEHGLGPSLSEAKRILKPGGFIFISVPFQNYWHIVRNLKKLWKCDINFDKELGYKEPMRFYQWRFTKTELQREFEMQGFKTLEIKPINKLHGVSRLVKTALGVDYSQKKTHAVLKRLLYPFVPRNTICHSLIGIAIKRENNVIDRG